MEILTLIIATACVLLEFISIIRLDRENEEQLKTIKDLDNCLTFVNSKVENRDKLIKDYTEALDKISEILSLEILASDKCDKIKELVRHANIKTNSK